MSNGPNDKAFDAMNSIVGENENIIPEGGEVSAWFPKGQFLGMDVPSGTGRIVDTLVSAAIGGSATGLGTSVSKFAPRSVGQMRAAEQASRVPKTFGESERLGRQAWGRVRAAEEAARTLSPQLQSSVVRKAVREVGKHNKDKMRFIQEEIKGIQKARHQIINDNMKRITSSSEKAGYRKHLKELESDWALSDFRAALSDWSKSGTGIKLEASRVGRFNTKMAKLTPEAERFYAEAVRSLKPNVSGAAAGAAVGSQRERVEQY